MKKILLSGFVGLFGLVSAQSLNIGFEQSEGYSAGTLAGQGVWGATTVASTITVTSEAASSGTQSIKQVPGLSQQIGGVITSTNYLYAGTTIVEFDFFVPDSAADTWFMVTPQDPDNSSIVGRFVVGPDIDGIYVVDYNSAGSLAYTDTGASFTRNVWHKAKMEISFDDGEINYFVDGVNIYTGALVAGTTAVGNIVVSNDNYDGAGYAYFDNLKLYDAATAGVNDIKKSSFTVYPNPTADFLNISGKANVSSAQVYDLTGKAINVAVSNNQIDVRNLAKGTYVVKIQTAEGTSTQKFIKK